MDKFVIEGPSRLAGEVTIAGAKNAALPCLAAALLTSEPVRLTNLPDVADIRTMGKLLGHIGARVETGPDEALIEVPSIGSADAPYELADPRNILYTACLQCNTGCGIKCKLQNGVVTKIDGNPYNPWTLLPHLGYQTPLDDATPVDGSICPKGQAGLQTAYDPYRIRKVLKRAGHLTRDDRKKERKKYGQAGARKRFQYSKR